MPELSLDAKRDLIRGKLDPDNKHDIWVRDVYSDKVIIEDDGKLYEVPYTIGDKQEVTLGDKKEVVVSYEALGELKDIEVVLTGDHTAMSGDGVTFTEADLEEMAENNNELADLLQPPLVATHNEGENTSIQVFGFVDGGKFHNFRKIGGKLFADLKNMPKKAVELLGEVKEFRLSAEVYKNFIHKGKAYGRAIRRVSVVDIPAIKDLTPASEANLFKEKPDQETTWILLSEQIQSKQRKEKITMSGKMIDVSKLSETDILKLQETAAKAVKLMEENDRLTEENEGHATKLSEHAQTEKSGKVKVMITPLREAGLAPAVSDRLEAFCEKLDSIEIVKFGEQEHSVLSEFGEILDSIIKRDEKGTLVVQFGETAPGSEGKEGKGSAAEQLSALTTKKLSENKDMGYADAFSEVQVENKELADEYAKEVTRTV